MNKFYNYSLKIILSLILLIIITSCDSSLKPKGKPETIKILTTGYCSCKKCTGWKRNWRFQPVFAYGPNKGKKKEIGITADGSRAKKGVIAADTKYYPFGTIFYIKGYGYGEVHDRGAAIKGPYRLDLFFSSHSKALKWGKRKIKVKVWKKRKRKK